MLLTYDGNDSLKRILRKEKELDDMLGEGVLPPPRSSERTDSRKVRGDYYLSREEVNEWAKEVLAEMISANPDAEVGIFRVRELLRS